MKYFIDIIHEQNKLLAQAADVIAVLIKERDELAESARAENIPSPTTVSIVLTGKGKSVPIQTTIAETLGVPYEALMLTPNQIRARLLERDITLADIAKQLRVSVVITRKGRSRRIQEHIAQALGMPYERLWGKKAA